MTRTPTTTVALLAAMMLGGCANTPQMRVLAGQIGSYADAHRAANLDAKRRFDALNADIARERAQTEDMAAAARRRTSEITRAVKLSDPKKVLLAEASAPDAIVAGLKTTTSTAPPLDAGNAAARLEAASKVAAQMAVKPKRLAQVQEVFGVYSEIQAALEKVRADAAAESEAVESKAANKEASP